jgi:hypothetical protein
MFRSEVCSTSQGDSLRRTARRLQELARPSGSSLSRGELRSCRSASQNTDVDPFGARLVCHTALTAMTAFSRCFAEASDQCYLNSDPREIIEVMQQVLVRNLDDDVKTAL